MKITIVGAGAIGGVTGAHLLHEIEGGARPLQWSNLDEIGALARALGRTGE